MMCVLSSDFEGLISMSFTGYEIFFDKVEFSCIVSVTAMSDATTSAQ